MKLLVDIGNSNITCAIASGDEIDQQWRLETIRSNTSDQWLDKLKEPLQEAEFDLCLIGSVVPSCDQPFASAIKNLIGIDPIFVTDETEALGIAIDVDHPDHVGADRLLNAVAAYAQYGAPAVVIDFGTATTFDCVDSRPAYIGGVIAPGVKLSGRALSDAAEKLPDVEISKPPSPIGRNTVHAMQSGLFWGYDGMIRGLLTRVTDLFEEKPQVIATGGLAEDFAREIEEIDTVDPDLTLKGLIALSKSV